jgi:hypothetical protein
MADEVKTETVVVPEVKVEVPAPETPVAEVVPVPVVPVPVVSVPSISPTMTKVVEEETTQPKESFSKWVFRSLVERGVIRDYETTPRSGRGKPPAGNLSIQQARIKELRVSTDPNDVLWGLLGASLLGVDEEVGAGKKILNQYNEYSKKYYTENPAKFFEIMKKAAICAGTEYKEKYKKN